MIDIKRFKYSNKKLMRKAFDIRKEVFVVEQNVDPKEEYEFEEESIHFILFANSTACATARYRRTKEGIKLERFAVIKLKRGKGYGLLILKAILEDLQENVELKYLHAQVQVVPFYEKVGFKKRGELFEEAGIMHYKMIIP